MFFFDWRFTLFLLACTLPLLFLPKINLIEVAAGETAGLRIDDLILLFIGIFLIWAHIHSNQRLFKIEGWVVAITCFGFFSFLCNRLLFAAGFLPMDSKIFYCFRMLEYFMFFYIGTFATKFFNDRSLVKVLFIWILALMTLQKLGIVGGLTTDGYLPDVSSRVPGIASFPSEMGLLLNLIFCFFIFDEETSSSFLSLFRSPFTRYIFHKVYLYTLFCLFGYFIVITGNRISIVALFVCFVFRIKHDLSFRSIGSYLSILILVPIVSFAVGSVIMETISVYQRSSNLFNSKNLELVSLVWDKIDTEENPTGNERLRSASYDASWFLRIHKWMFVTKSFVTHPECYLQGLGPGYAGAAVDGGILRILTEFGFVGAFIFFKFFRSISRINLQSKWMMVAFMINMIFFDAYLAYKTMSFLLFTTGYFFQKERNSLSVSEATAQSLGTVQK